MKKILEIMWIEERVKDGKPYFKTKALLETGEEAEGYGRDFKVGDEVEYWFDEKWGVTKMQHGGNYETKEERETES